VKYIWWTLRGVWVWSLPQTGGLWQQVEELPHSGAVVTDIHGYSDEFGDLRRVGASPPAGQSLQSCKALR
jgi:hypothetical protein